MSWVISDSLGTKNMRRQKQKGFPMSDMARRIFTIMKDPVLASFATITENGKPWVRYVMAHTAED
jgi:hypothetical protein